MRFQTGYALCDTHVVADYSLWAKDLVFVMSDGYLDGMQAWITTYHGEAQPSKPRV